MLMRCYRMVWLAVMIVLVTAPARLARADEWKPVSPDDLKMTSLPEAPGAPAVYLYRQVDRNDASRASSEYNYVRIKILTEEGRKHANIEIPFIRGKISVSNIRARLIRPDGSSVPFDGKVYESTIEKSKTQKVLAKTFTVPDVQVGSIIDYHFNYDFEDMHIFDSYWLLSDDLFTKHGEFTLKPYTNEGWTVQWNWPAGLPKGTDPPKEGADGIIRMTSNNIPAFVTEDYMPPEDELKFRVVFVYFDSFPERDPQKFWKSFGKKQADRAESFVSKKKGLEEVVAQTVSPNDPPEVKLKKIYIRTQQIRNLSYEPQKSEQEEKRDKQKIASSAEELLKLGYGDGYYITWAFLGLARAAGFEAYPCLVSARNLYFFNPQRINKSELNSNVVLVKLNGKDTYYDPGTKFAPFGLLPWYESGVTGLKLDKEGGTWITTTLPPSSDSQIDRTADLKITPEGDLSGKLKLSFTGLEALSRRMTERLEDEAARKKYLEDLVKNYIPAGIELDLTNKPDWNASETPLTAEFDLKVPGWVSSAGKRALLPAALFGATEKHLFEHADRTWPVYFDYPFKKVDDLTVELPLGWQIGDLPKETDTDAKAAEYSMKVEKQNGKLHIQRVVRCDLMMVGKEQYPILRNFFANVRTNDDQQIVLQPGTGSASN
ncbi:MAG: DUF3857 domain-containing protein [Acidobacteria bacterium]|nr:DUF3857 domain-containing protein [Acidobacteriota bacterium]MBS1864760.1 DUF3857 domain-containing protein [Acidobacteriota bacterium]